MNLLRFKKWVIVLLSVVLIAFLAYPYLWENKVDFNTDIKPLINKKCISCHGGVKAKGGFSLLFQEEAFAPTESGKPAIIPGDPDHSEFIKRITSKDPEERMPYKHEPLTEKEIELFRTWIQQGAPWGRHWAYEPLKKPTTPSYREDRMVNEVDAYILEKLEENNLDWSAEADKNTLLRRVSLDLIGMPAPKYIADKYLKSTQPNAYTNLVDELLASPKYGEKWASMWLDLARYADTRGYEADRGRTIWQYRDWVIDAFNADMPLNTFITTQLAGDLKSSPSDADYIATGFHRNTMTNDEGGSDNEEFRTAAVLDRVNTTWTALMGTTFNCVQCHSHPYDPFKHEDYYKFMAYFNNSRDEDTNEEYPLLRQYNPADQEKINTLRQWVSKNVSSVAADEQVRFLKTWQPVIHSLQCDQYKNASLVSGYHAGLRIHGSCRLQDVSLDNAQELLFRYVSPKSGGIWSLRLDSLRAPVWKKINLATTGKGWNFAAVSLPPAKGRHDIYFTYENNSIVDPNENAVIFDWFKFHEGFPGKEKAGADEMKVYFDSLLTANVKTSPIIVENPEKQKRKTFIFERGSWMAKGQEVSPDLPAYFKAKGANYAPNRMGLAQWITAPENPLTARTMANRLWEQIFGNGLVETLEDMGSQGITPTHPALLDALAWNLIHVDQWSMKKAIKRIVLSATYRQSSHATKELLAKDPSNKLYARGPRVRLTAEQLRDQALMIAGVLNDKMYGPGVMPYQPAGVWNSPYNHEQWTQSTGGEEYRRAVYIYWKRSAAYPSNITFDGAARQVCIARRVRTNTPLQALTLLNDPAYFDLARQLAFRMESAGNSITQKIQQGFIWTTGRKIDPIALETMNKLYQQSFIKYKNNPDKTCDVIGVMNAHVKPETAALVMVANAMLNLDEVIMKN